MVNPDSIADTKKRLSKAGDIYVFIENSILQRHRLARSLSRCSYEAKLLSKIQRLDPDALRVLYKHYHARLRHELALFVKNETDVEDLVQDLFLHIWETASTFDLSRGSVYSWLITMTRNRAIDMKRSRAYRWRENRRADVSPDTLQDAEDDSLWEQIVRSDRNELLRNALSHLPPAQRDTIRSAYWGGFTHQEIGDRLHIPLGTVKTRIRQGLRKLQSLLCASRRRT